MSKKTLLSESQIRRFMTLANQQPLAAGYIGRGRAAGIISEQDEDMMGGPEGLEDEDADPVGPDLGDDMGMQDTGVVDEATVEELVGELAKTITQVTGVVVTAEGDDEGVEDDLGGLEDEAELGALPDEGPAIAAEDEPMLETRRWVRAQLHRLLSEQGMPPGPPPGPPPGAGALPPGPPPGAGGGMPPIPPEAMGPLMALVRALSGGGAAGPGPMAEGTHMPSGANEGELINQGPNSDRTFESDDNRQSSAGQHHMGGGAAKASRTHMGGNSAALPLEEGITDDLLERVTRRVAAKLLNKRRR